MKKHRILYKALALAMAATCLVGCGQSSGTTGSAAGGSSAAAQGENAGSQGEKVVTVALSSAWDTMMPTNPSGNFGDFVFDQIYDRLVYTKADGTHEPRLAKSWEVSEDKTTITFTLQEGVTWQDSPSPPMTWSLPARYTPIRR